jgi:hypothetical protein
MLEKPSAPSRALHLLWLWLSAIFAFGHVAYLVWAEHRRLLTWEEVIRVLLFQVLPPSVMLCAVGLLLRWRWLRKKRAVQAFEQRLGNLAPLDF